MGTVFLVHIFSSYIRLSIRICYPYLIIGWGDEVLGPGGIWGRVQGVGSHHWGTRSQP